jgi:hypothetical protein
MQRFQKLVAGLLSGALSVAPLLSISMAIINLYQSLTSHMLSHPSSIYNGGIALSIIGTSCGAPYMGATQIAFTERFSL